MVFLSTAIAQSPGVSEEGIGYFILTLSRFHPLFPPPRATVFEKRDKNARQSTEGAPLTDSHFDLLSLIFMNVFIRFDLPWNSCFLGHVCQLIIFFSILFFPLKSTYNISQGFSHQNIFIWFCTTIFHLLSDP